MRPHCFFPVYAKQRDQLRKYLIEHDIFCPIHWPKLDNIDERYQVHGIISNIISIPIDQRYENEDMQRIINAINDFYGRV